MHPIRLRFSALACLLGLSVLLWVLPASAEITITLEPAEGATLSDIATVVARVESTDPIDKVEFSVDDKVRATDTSVAYSFAWDTLEDKEGEHTLTVKATDSNSVSKQVTARYKIDNEFGSGASALAQKAIQALEARDVDKARRYSRRALKVDPNNVDAARALAGIYVADRDLERAIATLEKVETLNSSLEGMRDLAEYRMTYALRPEQQPNFLAELEKVQALQARIADAEIKALKDKQAPPEEISAVQIQAGRYADAVETLRPAGDKPDAPVAAINRLALAYTLDNRTREASQLLQPLLRSKTADAATRAVMGLALLRTQQFEEARDLVAADATAQVPAALIIAAYADSVLAGVKSVDTDPKVQAKHRQNAVQEARAAARLLPQSPDAQYALSMATTEVEASDAALSRTLATAPFEAGPLLDQSMRFLTTNRAERFEQTLKVANHVVQRQPDNINARLVQAIMHLQSGRKREAETILGDLLKEQRNQPTPDVLVAVAVYWEQQNNPGRSQPYLDAARKLDRVRFDMAVPGKPLEYIYNLNRKMRYRAGFFLMPSTLYAKSTAAAKAE